MEKLIEEYRQLAASYDHRFRLYNEKTIATSFSLLGDQQDKTVVDIGCGTGIFLKFIAEHYPNADLYGVDIVPEMLAIARQRLTNQASLIEASASHIPLASDVADTVISTSALHYFPDQPRALKEIFRLLKPGGQLLITDWCADYFSNRLAALWLQLRGKGHFHMLNSIELTTLIEASGFTDCKVERYKINWLWGMTSIRAGKPTE